MRVGENELAECSQCGGVWVDRNVLERIYTEREALEKVIGMPTSEVPKPVAQNTPSGRLYVACPECAQVMHRVNFAGCSGVIVDWCRDHGTWFDRDELRQVVTFIQVGGLQKSRER